MLAIVGVLCLGFGFQGVMVFCLLVLGMLFPVVLLVLVGALPFCFESWVAFFAAVP